MKLRAPFPWFGGKSRAAHLVWPRFGAVHNYVEPFAGSLAVLLNRPHDARVETVNDLDCYLANFWRALQHDPDQVAYYADSPVNEADLHARHRWLVESARERAERVMVDAEFYDAQIAGWWVWGQCLWIGSGWCGATRPNGATVQHEKRRPGLKNDKGVNVQRQRTAASRSGENPHLQHKRFRSDGAGGVIAGRHANGTNLDLVVDWNVRPDLSSTNGRGGVIQSRKRPAHNGNGQAGGVHRRWQGGGERGGGSGAPRGLLSPRTEGLYAYLQTLSHRLRRVRVCCGDWARVLTPSVTTYIGTTAVFLDPPYQQDLRERCYSEDHDISADVRAWALEHGEHDRFRIALCGYEGEHEMPRTWACVPWKAHGGYSRSPRGKANRERERIWFSPHCLAATPPLFEAIA